MQEADPTISCQDAAACECQPTTMKASAKVCCALRWSIRGCKLSTLAGCAKLGRLRSLWMSASDRDKPTEAICIKVFRQVRPMSNAADRDGQLSSWLAARATLCGVAHFCSSLLSLLDALHGRVHWRHPTGQTPSYEFRSSA